MFKIYMMLQWGNIRSRFQYAWNSLLGISGLTVISITSALSIFILLKNLPGLDGWTIWQLLFLNGMWRLAHGLFLVFGQSTWTISSKIRTGTMDRYLIRPISPLFQLLTSDFQVGGLGYLLGGLIIYVVAASNLGLFWTIPNILISVFSILVGFIIEFALFLMVGTLAFWVKETGGINSILLNLITNFHPYPISIYNVFMQIVLTFIIPISFINYYPSFLMLDIHSEVALNSKLIYAGFAVGVIFLGISVLFWRYGLTKYNSTGS